MANMTFGVNIIPKDNTVSLGTSQNKWKINGVDDPKLTDTTYSEATTSTAGLMSATDKSKLDGIAAGAQVNSVTGVKGNAENSYRTGNINLTPANIGAPSTTGSGASGTWDIGITGNAATATKATQDGSGDNIGTTYLKMNTNGGIASCKSDNSSLYFKIATINITKTYINRPIVFEISGRGFELSQVQLIFANSSGTDPALGSLTTNNWPNFWVKKTATSTWEVYGKYTSAYGNATLHRLTGCGADIGVTVDMVNIGINEPSEATKATYSGNVDYANKATKDGDENTISSTYLKLSGGTMTGNLLGNSTANLGATANPFHRLVLGGATTNTMTADSTNPGITFQENTGTQPVHLIYTDSDSYRSPAGLKVIGGSSATPAWFEVEGQVYAAGFNGPLSGNATTATKLATARNINGTSFDGSAAITTANWGTARNITIKDASSTNAGTAVSVNGSAAVTLLLPSTIKASITGNCSGSATKIVDAGNSSKTLTIRYNGDGASATDWLPMHDNNGNLVPVSSTNLANKIRDKASGTWAITAATANSVSWANVTNKPTSYKITNTYVGSVSTSSGSDVTYWTGTINIPAGNYYVVATCYVHQDTDSGEVKLKWGNTVITTNTVSDGASMPNGSGTFVMLSGFINNATGSKTISIIINSGNSSRKMYGMAYMPINIDAISVGNI